MPWFPRFSVNIIDIVWMEDTRFGAIENSLFAWWIGEAETAPAVLRNTLA
jgi:hypothetical protein